MVIAGAGENHYSSEKQSEYGLKIEKELRTHSIRAEFDRRNESWVTNREAQMQKIPYWWWPAIKRLIKTVSVR